MSHADTLITHVTQASTTERAEAIARQYKPTVIRQAADLLFIDPEGHGVAWLRRAIVAEARAGVPERSAAETPGTIASAQAFGWGA